MNLKWDKSNPTINKSNNLSRSLSYSGELKISSKGKGFKSIIIDIKKKEESTKNENETENKETEDSRKRTNKGRSLSKNHEVFII